MEIIIFNTAKEFFKYRDKIEDSMIINNRSLLNKEKQLIAIYQPQEKNQSIDMKKQKPTPAQKIFEEVLPEEVEQFIKIIKPVKNVDKIINGYILPNKYYHNNEDERSNN